MTVPEHLLLSFRGHFGTTNTARETWSFGLRLTPAGVPAALGLTAMTQGITDAARTKYAAFHQNPTNKVSSHAFFDEVRGYVIGTDGKAKDEPKISTLSSVAGGSGTGHFPWQTTVAVTLDAGFPAKGRYGRFYLPTMNVPLDDSGLMSLTTAQDLLANVDDFLAVISNGPQLDTGYGIAVIGSTGVNGTARPVESIRIGRVVDTQRRRRRQVGEAYVSKSFSA